MRSLLFLPILIVVASPSAFAGMPAASIDPAAGTAGGIPVGGSVHGWEFTPNVDLLVTHLGLFDHVDSFETTPRGLLESQWVGVFETDETLLYQTSLLPGTQEELLDNFRYTEIPTLRLEAGTSYVVAVGGATGSFSTANRQWDEFSVPPVFVPEIDYVRARFDQHGGRLFPYPRQFRASEPYRFGPNFRFTAVPEPGTFGVVLSVLVLCVVGRTWVR